THRRRCAHHHRQTRDAEQKPRPTTRMPEAGSQQRKQEVVSCRLLLCCQAGRDISVRLVLPRWAAIIQTFRTYTSASNNLAEATLDIGVAKPRCIVAISFDMYLLPMHTGCTERTPAM